ncbi:cupin domain-containing protein [Micromonospora sp. NPDC049102]|uniref:cupin domain-containing protein n=1 Tax=Micromonospora sp. NPDC049102 TaxID=3364265 RepID=UPI00371BB215
MLRPHRVPARARPPALRTSSGLGPPCAGAGNSARRLLAQKPQRFPGGQVRVADVTQFAAATTICAALVEVDPGGMRKLHWHPNGDEWQYYLSGHGQMGVFASSGVAGTFDMRVGVVGYVPFAYGHDIENLGTGARVDHEVVATTRRGGAQ